MNKLNTQNRREFLGSLAKYAGAAATLSMLPRSIRAALETPPAFATGTIKDVQHVVIFMQENRSFDHYFGSLRGVRGFNDRHVISMPNGDPVWKQPGVHGVGSTLPFHFDTKTTNAQYVHDLPHGWHDQHEAWNHGRYDKWIPAKKVNETPLTMGFHKRADVPYHYALADAFTICDQYFCSVLGPTLPNRRIHWTGKLDPTKTGKGKGQGPVTGNDADDMTWTTYPERLQKAGISWRMYQQGMTNNPETGNYEDNPLVWFSNYKTAPKDSPLHVNAMVPWTLDDFKKDVMNNRLPQVSWMVAPELYSEHPSAPPGFGAYYTSLILDALTANPEVWSKTVFIVNFDENDGFFDHVPPFTPPRSKTEGLATMDVSDEFYTDGNPYGLGPRVPLMAISPWSCGGYVCSQVFDHTSVLQFLEQRFGVAEPNISAWRRAVCGNLKAAFDFTKRNFSEAVQLPPTSNFKAMAKAERHLPAPTAPTTQTMPEQEPGTRPARSLPYEFHANGKVLDNGHFSIEFASTGTSGGAFNVHSQIRKDGPWKYAVESGKNLSDDWNATGSSNGAYDLEVFGANGFYRRFSGNTQTILAANMPRPEVALRYDRSTGNVVVVLTNTGKQPCTITVADELYKNEPSRKFLLAPGQTVEDVRKLQTSAQWYELTVQVAELKGYLRHFAGHVETGRDSTSDPAMATAANYKFSLTAISETTAVLETV